MFIGITQRHVDNLLKGAFVYKSGKKIGLGFDIQPVHGLGYIAYDLLCHEHYIRKRYQSRNKSNDKGISRNRLDGTQQLICRNSDDKEPLVVQFLGINHIMISDLRDRIDTVHKTADVGLKITAGCY